jgi:hypothetical protein
MKTPKIDINNRASRYPRTTEAARDRDFKEEKSSRRRAVILSSIAGAVGVWAALNSGPAEEPPRPEPTQEQSTTVDHDQEIGGVENIVDPDSIRTVNFEQQQDGSFTAVSEIEDSGSDTEI